MEFFTFSLKNGLKKILVDFGKNFRTYMATLRLTVSQLCVD